MAWTFRGNINGVVDSQAQSLPMIINNFTLVNKTGGGIVANVYLINGSQVVNISPYGGTINANAIYTSEIPRLLRSDEVIRLATNGSCDYSFELENTEPTI
jgi:energy-converting hydrogenase Eha subunit B